LSRQQKEAGTLLLDIGSGTTNLIVVEDGEVQHVAVIGIGGTHITNDLAIGLKTDLDIAEKVKVEFAQLGASKKPTAVVAAGSTHHTFSMDDIVMITEARVEELFEYVDKEVRKIRHFRKLPGGVVLPGGPAKLPDIAPFVKEKLQLASRVGSLQSISGLVEAVEDVSYATAVGLMLLDMLLVPDVQAGPRSATQNALGMVDSILRKFHRR